MSQYVEPGFVSPDANFSAFLEAWERMAPWQKNQLLSMHRLRRGVAYPLSELLRSAQRIDASAPVAVLLADIELLAELGAETVLLPGSVMVPTWSASEGAPFAEVVRILVANLGEYGLRQIMAVDGIYDLNWWFRYVADGHMAYDLLWRCRGLMNPMSHSEAVSRYITECNRLGA